MAELTDKRPLGYIIKVYGVLAILCGAGCYLAAGAYIKSRVKSWQVKEWPRALATVTEGQVVNKEALRSGRRGDYVERTSTVEIEYAYQVNGVGYIGGHYDPHADRAPHGDWITILQTIKVGARYEIYYNPEDPGESYFTHAYVSPRFWGYVALGLGIVAGTVLIRHGVNNMKSAWDASSECKVSDEDEDEGEQEAMDNLNAEGDPHENDENRHDGFEQHNRNKDK